MPVLLDSIDVLVVGAGLFGQVIAKHLTRQGRTVTIVDAGYEESGSAPAACIMKGSWLTKMTKNDQATAMAVLDENYGVHEIEAYVQAVGKVGVRSSVYWVAPRSILKPEKVLKGKVAQVDVDEHGPWYVVEEAPGIVGQEGRGRANMIVVAAGAWCNRILPEGLHVRNLRSQYGAAFTWPCEEERESRVTIKPWAPYKQLVMLPNRYPGELWVGDGTAVFELTPKRLRASAERCAWFAGMRDMDEDRSEILPLEPERTIIGRRPYIRGLADPAYVVELKPGLWVATGGAKNGTAGAGWAAYKIAQATN